MKTEQTRKMADTAFDQLSELLEQGKSSQFKAYLSAMARFHRYSFGNVMLIASQKENATRVAGFHTWKKLGRHVSKGQKGIMILAPIVRRSKEIAELGEDKDEVVMFRSTYVWDISQTEGKELPELARAQGNPGSFLERLKALIDKQGITLKYSDGLGSADGVSTGGTILIRPNMDAADEFSVIVHELAHENLHTTEEELPPRTVRELEAEAVAYIVSEAIGLDAGTSSADYIQLYQGDKKLLMKSMQRIRQTASQIITGIVDQEQQQDRNRITEPIYATAA